MFVTYCTECQKRQLIFPSLVNHLINDEQGTVAIFTCWCGALGAERLSTVPGHALEPLALAS